jgi:protein TonB
VRFADPEAFNRVFKETPLEVILVNASTDEKPDKAQAIAQKSLAGGGDLDKGRATSPLPPSAFTAVGDAAEDAQRQVDSMQVQQQLLLTQIKQQLANMPLPDPRDAGDPTQSSAQEEKRRQLLELLAEIEKRVREENARPRKRYLSPATVSRAEALYLDTASRRIEARGTQDFPEAAGKKLHGTLRMEITVNYDGRLVGVDVVEPSGNPLLDRRAQAIVRGAGNFGKFTDEMRRQGEQIVFRRYFIFHRDETTELSSK